MPEQIVIVSDSARIEGGASRIGLLTAQLLAQRGCQVTVLAGKGPAEPSLAELPIRWEIKPEPAASGGLARAQRLYWDREAADFARQALRHLDPRSTLVHIHSFREELSASVIRAIADLGLPMVYTSHDYAIGCPVGGFYDYRRHAICPLVGLSASCVATNCTTSPYPRKFWTAAKHATHRSRGGFPNAFRAVFYVSEFSRKVLERYVGDHVFQTVLRNPTAGEQPPRRDPRQAEGFLFVGRLSEEKDPLTVARAAARLGAKMTFVGEGPDAEAILKAYPAAELTGWLPASEVRQRMRQAAGLILASRLYETQGMVVDEAASEGVPSLAPATTAAADFIRAGGGGLLFEVGDVDSLKSAMSSMLAERAFEAMGHAAYQHFWSSPQTETTYTDELLGLYDRVMAR